MIRQMGQMVLFIIWVTFFYSTTQAKTIHIPSDASSVKEAVEVAVSGDEIRLETDEVQWVINKQFIDGDYVGEGGIRIQKKDLTISGLSPDHRTHIRYDFIYRTDASPEIVKPETSLLWIEDATVTLHHLDTDSYWHWMGPAYRYFEGTYKVRTAPIVVLSGALLIQDCTLAAPIRTRASLTVERSHLLSNTFISSPPYSSHSSLDAGIQIGSATNITVAITDSVIGMGNSYCYRAMDLFDLRSSHISIVNSIVQSGVYGTESRSDHLPHPGAAAIRLRQCNDLVLDLTRSRIMGGEGIGANARDTSSTAAPGGNGMDIEDSQAFLISGTVTGGLGGSGGRFVAYSGDYNAVSLPSGPGGNGASLIRSQIKTQNILFQSGLGGPTIDLGGGEILPAGNRGFPWVIDAESSIQEITTIASWDLY